jgi:hypothetical protein
LRQGTFDVTKSLLLIRASALAGLRWAKEHIYSLLILGPVVVGISYFTAWRMTGNLPEWEASPSLTIAIAVLFEISLIALSLSRTTAEIFHLRRPESYFDALPIPVSSHLHAALATRTLKTLVIAIAAVIARATFGEAESFQTVDLVLTICFVAITSLSEIVAALNWIHWGHKRDPRAAIEAVLMLAISATLAGFVLALFFEPTYFTPSFEQSVIIACVVWIVLLYAIANRLHHRWRSSDLEYAKRLQTPNRSTEFITRAIRRRLPRIVAAQLARDVQLTVRGFSSAVYVGVAVAAIWTLAMAVALATDFLPAVPPSSQWLDATWLPQVIAVKIACVLAVISLGSLLPVLIAYELPHFWLERAAGTTGLDIWRAKLWYARLITTPAPLLVWFAGAITDKLPAFYVLPLLAECLWLWWLVSSLMGALSFEMPTRPELAIIVTGSMSFAMGLLASLLWPIGLIAYPQVMHSLTDRGRHRTRYYLITGDE